VQSSEEFVRQDDGGNGTFVSKAFLRRNLDFNFVDVLATDANIIGLPYKCCSYNFQTCPDSSVTS